MTTHTKRTLEVETIAHSSMTKSFEIADELGLPSDDNLKPFECLMRIINQKDGDKRITWDSRDFKSIHAAKKLFDELIAEGFVPYIVGKDGTPTKMVMEEFNPFAEQVEMVDTQEVVMSPEHMLAGG